jgi:hypothetical protein
MVGADIFAHTTTLRQILQPTQPPIQIASHTFSQELQGLGRNVAVSPEFKNARRHSLHLLPNTS